VLEIDVHSQGSVDSPVKARLEKEAAAHHRLNPSEMQKKLEEDLGVHSKNRERIIDEKVRKAHGEVEHAKHIFESHKREMLESVDNLRHVIDEKQKWAQDLRTNLQDIKVNWARADLEKASALSEEQKAYQEAVVDKLSESLARSQEIAARNRAALEQFKRVQASCDVEHSKEISDYIKEREKKAVEVIDISLERQQQAAALLRTVLLREKSQKAHSDVEYSKLVHDQHESEEKKKVEELELSLEQKDIQAFSNRRQHINEIRLNAHDEVMHAKEVAIERKEAQESSESDDPVIDELEERLNVFCNDLDEQRTPLDEWFHDHVRDLLDYEVIPGEDDPKIKME